MSFDIKAIRSDFPILHQEINSKPLVYLDNAATTQKPQVVLDALTHYYQHDNANVHRGAHTLGDRATADFETARKTVQQFINASSEKEIIWTQGTTESINLVASGLTQQLKPGDEILVSRMEHHANIVPWQVAAEKTGATLKVIELNEAGELKDGLFDQLLSDKTRILAISWASNALGTINPVKEMVAKARSMGAITLVDAAQAVSHFRVDVQDIDCDFLAFSGHKLLGPTGIGVLYGKTAMLEALPPYQLGGEMIERVSFEKTTYNVLPYKFEAGTPPIAQAIGLAAAIDYISQLDRQAAKNWEHSLLKQATEMANDIPGMRIIGQAKEKVSVMSFMIDGLHPSDIGTLLDQQGIAIRTGHHCAMPLMDSYGLPGTARASFAFYNTPEEVELLFTGLAKIQRMFT
jgi:cysteine desulfurase/selenocysteine lyase